MKPGDYWKERMAAVEDMSHEKGINYAHNVEQQFRQAEKALSDKITIWYKRLADNNENISRKKNPYLKKLLVNPLFYIYLTTFFIIGVKNL